MRDLGNDAAAQAGRSAGAALTDAPSVAEIEAFAARLALDAAGLDDAERIDGEPEDRVGDTALLRTRDVRRYQRRQSHHPSDHAPFHGLPPA